jgi:hypothetical protein
LDSIPLYCLSAGFENFDFSDSLQAQTFGNRFWQNQMANPWINRAFNYHPPNLIRSYTAILGPDQVFIIGDLKSNRNLPYTAGSFDAHASTAPFQSN